MTRPDRRDEQGQVTLLILGFAVVVLLLVTVVTNASKAFLWQRSISSYADAAALAASQSVGEPGLYAGDLSGSLPVVQADAMRAVDAFVADNGLLARFPALDRRVAVDAATGTVSVTLTTRMPLAFPGGVAERFGDGVEVGATASATAPLQ